MGIKHAFTSTKEDGGDSTLVKPSDWNASHIEYPLDIPPVSPSAYDDEFPGTSLDVKWTAGAMAITTTIANGIMTLMPNIINKHGYFIRQISPLGDFTVMARLANSAPIKLDDQRPGIFVARTASSLALVVGYDSSNNSQAMAIEHSNYSESVDWAGYNGNYNTTGLQGLGLFYWYRIRYVSPNVFGDYSANGVVWYNFMSRAWLQPDRIGIVIENNSGNQVLTAGMVVDWFRVTEP